MIATAMVLDPRLLDEPTTALDVTTQAQILALIKDLQKRRGSHREGESIFRPTHRAGRCAG